MVVVGDKAVWQAETQGIELVNMTVGDLLDQQAVAFGGKEAIVYDYPEVGISLSLTYKQYQAVVNRLAKGLLALGIQKGEHVAIWAYNLPQWIFVQLAVAKVGAVLVTVNTAYRQTEAEYVLRQGDVTTLFLVEEARGNNYLASLYNIVPELHDHHDPLHTPVSSAALPKFKRAVLIGKSAKAGLALYDELNQLGEGISDAALQERQASLTAQDVAMIQYTSGTTGFPKGAEMTHYNIVNNARVVALGSGISPDERVVSPMPLFHVGGCVLAVLTCMAVGATYIGQLAFDPAKLLETISKQRGTLTAAVPTMLVAMLNNPRFLAGEFDLSSLKRVTSGGSPVPQALMEQVKAKFGADVGIVFGQTEAGGVITRTIESDSFDLKAGTVGLPMQHTDVKIVDYATGEPVAIGQQGELWTKGFLTMRGYYNMPEKTAETLTSDGWLRSGDLATMNQQGYIQIVGRVKDMIIRGGENIYPAEIEEFLMRHPKVAEAQVIGVPDEFMGEEIMAVLRLREGQTADQTEIRDYCRGKISHNKVPRYVRFVEAYPITVSGKVKKFELRQQMLNDKAP